MAQLLALMDGLSSRGEVIVIAATNRPNALDPAIRRGGRFDREIEIGIPNKNGRLEVLYVHTRGMPLDESLDLKEIADATHGFVGADLYALCKEAAMRTLERALPDLDVKEDIPVEVLESLRVTREDFRAALKKIEPSAMREVFVEVAEVHWDEVGGLEEAKQSLIESVEWPLKYPEAFSVRRRSTAPRHPALWPAWNWQNAAGKGSGHREQSELHQRQRPGAAEQVGRRIRARRKRDLSQSPSGCSCSHLLR